MLDCTAQLNWIRPTTSTNLQREEIKTVILSGPVFSSPKPQLTQKSQIWTSFLVIRQHLRNSLKTSLNHLNWQPFQPQGTAWTSESSQIQKAIVHKLHKLWRKKKNLFYANDPQMIIKFAEILRTWNWPLNFKYLKKFNENDRLKRRKFWASRGWSEIKQRV